MLKPKPKQQPVDVSLHAIQRQYRWMESWDQTLFDAKAKNDLAKLARHFERASESIWRELKKRQEASNA